MSATPEQIVEPHSFSPDEIAQRIEHFGATFDLDMMKQAAALIRAQAEKVRVLEARVASLEATVKHVNQTLCVPAAEYVPAIRDCFDIIDAALAKATGEA